jgi:hypothetical protein
MTPLDPNKIRPADYVNPEFFRPRAQSRLGDGLFALAMACRLRTRGVDAKEFAGFCRELAQRMAPQFSAASLSEDARDALRAAGGKWRHRCPETTELLVLAANALTDGECLAGLLAHLGRILNQLDLLASMPSPDSVK